MTEEEQFRELVWALSYCHALLQKLGCASGNPNLAYTDRLLSEIKQSDKYKRLIRGKDE